MAQQRHRPYGHMTTASLSEGPLTEELHEFHLHCYSATFAFGAIDAAQFNLSTNSWNQMERAAGFAAWRY